MAQIDLQEISNHDLEIIHDYLKGIRFGAVTLIVQNGKLVRIEKLETFQITR